MAVTRRLISLAGLAAILLTFTLRTSAHTISLTYAEVTITGNHVRWMLRLPVPELDLLFNLDRNHDGTVDAAELAQQSETVRSYVAGKVKVYAAGRELPASSGPLRLWKDSQGNDFVETEIVFSTPGGEPSRLTLHCDLLREAVSAHQTLAKVTSGGRTENYVFANGQDREWEIRRSGWQAFSQFVRMGVMHIFTGYDHIAFLLGVVLIGGSFRTLVKVVTSFTIAHSITLALAALNILVLPSRLVESGIALSIMYIALENLFFKSFDRRWIVTFFFGLVHGFGFASALQEVHLSGSLLGTALFSFNLGVEIGQVCIVALLLPALWYIQKHRFNVLVVRIASTGIFLLGSFWFWQRVSGA